MSERGTTVLIAGVPRSGTTWIGECLSAASTTAYMHEPDNELARPSAARAKRGIRPYPVLAPGESASEFERLWERLFDYRSSRSFLRPLERVCQWVAYRLAGTAEDKSEVRSALIGFALLQGCARSFNLGGVTDWEHHGSARAHEAVAGQVVDVFGPMRIQAQWSNGGAAS
jgi:hypothetical protein